MVALSLWYINSWLRSENVEFQVSIDGSFASVNKHCSDSRSSKLTQINQKNVVKIYLSFIILFKLAWVRGADWKFLTGDDNERRLKSGWINELGDCFI